MAVRESNKSSKTQASKIKISKPLVYDEKY